jgi:sugar/nucleoside kinase (ribokinase family)
LPEDLPLERELLASKFEMTLGSSSAILAHNLSVLGATVGFVTCVGKDPLGGIALQRLGEAGVDLSRTIQGSSDTSTGVSVVLSHGRERRILTYPGTMAELTCEDLDIDYLAQARHFHLSSLFLQSGLHPDLVRLLTELKARGLTISLDTNDDPSGQWKRDGILGEVLPLIDLLLPNEGELLQMTASESVPEALAQIGALVPLVVVKCGSRGALVHANGATTRVAPIQVTPVDTIGAGDSFNAGFLAAYLAGNSPFGSAAAGNVTGALSTLRPGGTEAFSDKSLREEFLRSHWPKLLKA